MKFSDFCNIPTHGSRLGGVFSRWGEQPGCMYLLLVWLAFIAFGIWFKAWCPILGSIILVVLIIGGMWKFYRNGFFFGEMFLLVLLGTCLFGGRDTTGILHLVLGNSELIKTLGWIFAGVCVLWLIWIVIRWDRSFRNAPSLRKEPPPGINLDEENIKFNPMNEQTPRKSEKNDTHS